MARPQALLSVAPATIGPWGEEPPLGRGLRDANFGPTRPGCDLRPHIDELMLPLRAMPIAHLNAELGERLRQIAPPVQRYLCVLTDHGCAGLDALAPRLLGTLPAESQRLYASLIFERDPLLARAALEWRPLVGTIEEHCRWIHENMPHADVIQNWLRRSAALDTDHLVVVPARGSLSRGAVFAFCAKCPADSGVFALFYAAQRLAVALEQRYRPYTAQLRAMRLSARERDVLRAGLRGAADRQIAQHLGLSVDAIRYYFTRLKRRVPVAVGHLKPRELARVLHQLGTL